MPAGVLMDSIGIVWNYQEWGEVWIIQEFYKYPDTQCKRHWALGLRGVAGRYRISLTTGQIYIYILLLETKRDSILFLIAASDEDRVGLSNL